MFQQHVFTEKENNQEEEGKKEGRKISSSSLEYSPFRSNVFDNDIKDFIELLCEYGGGIMPNGKFL